MNIIKNIFSFFKRIFNKHDNQKLIVAAEEPTKDNERLKYIDSLKVNKIKKEKKKVETLICDGDGLGIQDKLNY